MRPRRPGPAVFLIGIAAERAGMHPQTLRVYERRGLIRPRRSPRNTRLYSQADVDLLRRIQELGDEGLNLAGIERALRLERRADRAERRVKELERRLAELGEEHRRELAEVRRSAAGAQLVRVLPGAGTALAPRYTPIVTRPRTSTRRTV